MMADIAAAPAHTPEIDDFFPTPAPVPTIKKDLITSEDEIKNVYGIFDIDEFYARQEQAAAIEKTAASVELSPHEKYDYLTEYGTQILCLLSLENGCSYLSRNFESLTGQPVESAMGDAFIGLIHGDYQQRLRDILSNQLVGTKPLNFRCKFKHGEDAWQWYEFLIHCKRRPDQVEYVCIIENIHEHMLAQNNLQRAKLEAELALRARSEFLANMSHDLRTPLNAVIGFAQIIDSQMFGKIENPQYLDYVKHIQESGYDLLSKIEDLLEIANIDAGRVGLDRSESYLSDILNHVVDTQSHHAQSKHITLQYQIPQEDVLLFVDKLRIQHILGHLIANSIRHSAAGSIISMDAVMTSDQSLLLRVCDNGAGIQKKKLAEINAALKEENCWSAANSQGLGLGLALTKEFINLHGGTVKIISKENTGTTVYLTLPADCIRYDMLNHPRFAHLVAS